MFQSQSSCTQRVYRPCTPWRTKQYKQEKHFNDLTKALQPNQSIISLFFVMRVNAAPIFPPNTAHDPIKNKAKPPAQCAY